MNHFNTEILVMVRLFSHWKGPLCLNVLFFENSFWATGIYLKYCKVIIIL